MLIGYIVCISHPCLLNPAWNSFRGWQRTWPLLLHQHLNLIVPVFRRCMGLGKKSGKVLIPTSMLNLCEVLVHPLLKNNIGLYTQYCELLLENRTFGTVPITSDIAKRASMLRVKYGLRTPDALQLSAAIEAGCEAFLTGDKRLSRVTEIRVIQLDEIGQ